MLNFELPVRGLDGQPLKDGEGKEVVLGKLLAQQLAQSSKGDALKLFTWAMKLYAGDSLDLDPSDAKTLRDFVEASESMTVLAKAQLLNVF